MAVTKVECRDCGRIGKVTQQYMQVGGPLPGTIIDRMEGLDPEDCDGCRRTLRDAGFLVAVFSAEGMISAAEPEKLSNDCERLSD